MSKTVKNQQNKSQAKPSKLPELAFGIVMVIVMVYTMTCYNVALATGSMTTEIFIDAAKTMWPTCLVAWLAEEIFAGRLAVRLTEKALNQNSKAPVHPLIRIVVRGTFTVCCMCPVMSLFATLTHNFPGFDQLLAAWAEAFVKSFPMALGCQIFFAGPLVRWIFRQISHRIRRTNSTASPQPLSATE